MASRMVAHLVLRILSFIFLLASLIVLATNSQTLQLNVFEIKIRFKDVYAYRYMLATIVFGFVYTILQLGMTFYHIARGNKDGNQLFDFYGDKVISYIVATGAAAGFGVTKDLKDTLSGGGINTDKFFNKGYASASLLLIAFVFIALSSILSSYALPKHL